MAMMVLLLFLSNADSLAIAIWAIPVNSARSKLNELHIEDVQRCAGVPNRDASSQLKSYALSCGSDVSGEHVVVDRLLN